VLVSAGSGGGRGSMSGQPPCVARSLRRPDDLLESHPFFIPGSEIGAPGTDGADETNFHPGRGVAPGTPTTVREWGRALCTVSAVREFARTAIAEHLLSHDEQDYPEELISALRKLGVFGVNIPREYGGSGLSADEVAHIIYELARAWQPLAGLVGTHLKLCREFLRHGTPEQKTRLLPAMAAGELVCARGYHEQAANDPESLTSRIEYRNGSGVLNG